jgi:hypothetical protein
MGTRLPNRNPDSRRISRAARNELTRDGPCLHVSTPNRSTVPRGLSRACTHFGPLCLHRSVVGIEVDPTIAACSPVRLIVTSPPYPGVHVLYHRWQVLGRRETPAPFWIASSLDGSGCSYYTFGDRKQQELNTYYEEVLQAFRSIARVSDENTMIAKMIAFSSPEWQLPRYLAVMQKAGLVEVQFPELTNAPDCRVWRTVPNRKYANQHGALASSNEVVLFHRTRAPER